MRETKKLVPVSAGAYNNIGRSRSIVVGVGFFLVVLEVAQGCVTGGAVYFYYYNSAFRVKKN